MRNPTIQFLLSLLTTVVFLILAVGSDSNVSTAIKWDYEREELGEGKARITSTRSGYQIIEEGTYDKYYGKQGQFIMKVKDTQKGEEYVETAHFQNNVRHGLSEKKYADGRVVVTCYELGYPVSCEKSAKLSVTSENKSAFTVLEKEHPWFLFYFHAFGFESAKVKSFMNRIETKMAESEFSRDEFNIYYNGALEQMEEEEEFAEIIGMNTEMATYEGRENIKNNGLRKALIDKYRTSDKTTFAIVQSDYPAYLNEVTSFSSPGATVNEIELFCHELDTRIDAFGPLDPGDTYFPDSLDFRLYLALFSLLMEDQSVSALMTKTKSAAVNTKPVSVYQLQQQAASLLHRIIYGDDKQIAAATVAALLQQDFLKGDIVRQCVKKTYAGFANGGSGIAGNWESWFNNDYQSRVKGSINIAPGMVFSQPVSTTGLEPGMHILYFRFRDKKRTLVGTSKFYFLQRG